MLRVVIIDDEPNIREGLNFIIEWDKLGFEIVGEASNGREALLLIEKWNPNVVITDINMPEFSGLDLIEQCKARNLDISFIIISGYDEFNLAKKALNLGVINYLLKPVDEEELTATLLKIKDSKLKSESRLRTSNYNYKALFKDLILNSSLVDELLIKEKFKLNEFNSFYYIIFDFHGISINDIEIEKLIIENLDSDSPSTFNYEKESYYGFLVHSGHLSRFNGSISGFAINLISIIFNLTQINVSVYTGSRVRNINQISQSRDEALETLNHRYYYEKGRVIEYNQIKNRDFNNNYEDLDYINSYIQSIKDNNNHELEESVNNIIDYFITNYSSAYIINMHLNRLLNGIIELVSSVNSSTNEIITAASFILNRDSQIYLYSLETKLIKLGQIATSLFYYNRNKSNLSLYLKEYVDEHYKEMLSLKCIADKMDVNSAYLGQVFRKEYNVGFNDYLHQKRLEVAKKELSLNHLKIYEIAQEVGYTDVNYFMKKFEATFGVTPGQYRRTVRNCSNL
ncbi:MAG: response regulator [Spirochaetales bacterium]|nr:response regulator [Spirochaetales bacterium]